MRGLKLVWIILIFSGCTKSIQFRFLDEYVITDSIKVNNETINGVSGIDYHNGKYYMIIDDYDDPRIIICQLHINNFKIKDINPLSIIRIQKDSTNLFLKNKAFDLESLFVDKEGKFNLVSEGNIKKGKEPSIFIVDSLGKFEKEIDAPSYFYKSKGSPRHNGIFEGSCRSFEKTGFWVINELPLKGDGEVPIYFSTNSDVRITYFDHASAMATRQYVYQLGPVGKTVKGEMNMNGATAILEYKKDVFFVIERSYQSGYGSHGNTVKIFKATVEEESTNTLAVPSLKGAQYLPLKKELLFDFDTVKNKLTENIIDNIEGVTLGPTLSNGNKSLILVSDNNFQKFGKQLNQVILLEIFDK